MISRRLRDIQDGWRRIRCRLNRHRLEIKNAGMHWFVACKWCTFYQTWSPVARAAYARWRK